ncbi:MAG: hypothetical protein PWQ39_1489 [Thermacetogenium sp.]|nr:hypothetical protein [Thermacetogenium sp.]
MTHRGSNPIQDKKVDPCGSEPRRIQPGSGVEAGINRNAALQETPAAAPTERKKGFILDAAAALRRLLLALDERARRAAESRRDVEMGGSAAGVPSEEQSAAVCGRS